MALLGRDTSVTGPFPKEVLLLETLAGQEALGRPYKFELTLLSREPNLAPDDVLGKAMTVGIRLNSGDERFFGGIVSAFEKTGTTQLHTRYAVVLKPSLSLLDHTLDCRIFNDPAQNTLGIVTSVLAGRGLTAVESGAIHDHAYRSRDICVQFRESDLHFVQRLLEEEGIHYFFKHEKAKHTLVLADSVTGHKTASGYGSILYTAKERKAAGAEEHFWGMRVRKALYPGLHTVQSGYDPTKIRPKQPQFGDRRSNEISPGAAFEHYDSPGGLSNPEEAKREAKVRAQVCCVENTVVEVDGNTMGLGVGNLVSLRKSLEGLDDVVPFWKDEDFGQQFLVVGATYSLSIDQHETGEVAQTDEPFKAKYWLQDSHTQFRVARRTAKPHMGGPQTAVVVGPKGEEIWTDKFGRVMVQFDWDRLGGHNEKSSCWMRVGQMWSGGHWGAIHIPRIGREVLVRFLDGDPDRPIIAGAVYNKDNLPPYDLPANQTQSGIKSHSSKNGTQSNFNEIRFEDKKGAEELHLQAEKDMSTLVKNDQTLDVGHDRGIVVGHDETNLVENNRETTVDVNDSVVIGGNHDKTVTGTVMQIYGGKHSRKVDGDQELVEEKNKNEHVAKSHKLTTDKKFRLNQGATSMAFRGSNVTVDSAGTITLQAGGATVCIDKAGKAAFDSPTGIKFVCGGSALSILPGGIAIASPALTVAAGAGSVMAMGEDAVAMNGKTITIEADGVCSIKGKSKVRLQEAEGVKAKKSKGSSATPGESQGGSSGVGRKARKRPQKGAQPENATLQIHVVDLDGNPQEGLAFKIKMPDGETSSGQLDKEGRGQAKSASPGTFKVTFPELDGGDWDGDGALETPEEKRSESSRVKAQANDRVPAIARKHGFVNWRTIWDFGGNAGLRSLRENPNVLWDGDEVAISSKIEREAEVLGGSAELVVKREEEKLVRIRPLDYELQPLDGIRYQARGENSDINKGVIPPDGFVVLQVPMDARTGVLSLYLSDEAGAKPLDWKFDIQDEVLANSTEDEAQRLINLGFANSLPEGNEKTEDYQLALAGYRECVGKPLDDDDAIAGEMVAMHDGGGPVDPDDGTPQGVA